MGAKKKMAPTKTQATKTKASTLKNRNKTTKAKSRQNETVMNKSATVTSTSVMTSKIATIAAQTHSQTQLRPQTTGLGSIDALSSTSTRRRRSARLQNAHLQTLPPDSSESSSKMAPQKREVTGLRQSPIDIRPSSADKNARVKRSAIAPLTVDYEQIKGATGLTLENTGHGWKLNIPDSAARLCPITGGPLGTDQYRLLQIHSHWGPDASCGSEHTVEGKTFPCEVHLVHWNATKYANPGEAMEYSEDGLAVIGVFVEIGDESEPLGKICSGLDVIQFKGDVVPFDSNKLDLNAFLPNRDNLKYWNYEGSLTTPPYSESVIWIVLEDKITASEEQIGLFRAMNKNGANQEVIELDANWRDVQPLHNRTIAYFD